MSKKIFISNQYPQGKQLQKFQLPSRKQNQTYYNQQEYPSNNINKNTQTKLQKIIYDRINEVENQNQKLLDIANKLNNSPVMNNIDDRLPNIVYPIQQQMKGAFNELIQSIQQFYIDIDTKIKQIGAYLATLSGVDTLQTSKKDHQDLIFSSNHHHKQVSSSNYNNKQQVSSINEQQTIKAINNKIDTLQKDLQETKSNENKLMVIIQKLVEKYELTNETTMIKQDPFLKKKVQNLIGRVQNNQLKTQYNSPQHIKQQNYIESNDKFIEANTFARTNNNYINHLQNHQNPNQINNLNKGSLQTSNVVKKVENLQRVVSNNQNPNDYSIYYELNKLQDNLVYQNNNQRQFIQKNPNQNQIIQQNRSKPKYIQQKIDTSRVSVNSYAYSNSIASQQEEQCFIKKLYSKQNPSLNKVSLKGCTNNKTFFQFNKINNQQPIENTPNKNHREAYLLNQLKRFN